MVLNLINFLKRNINQVPGCHTRRKFVVLESDDWGGIKTPSINTYDLLRRKGFNVSNCPYLSNDCLESKEDLSCLFEVLDSVKDKNQRPAVVTADTVVANPDFEKIKDSGFQEYHFEVFTETYKRYPNHDVNLELWKEGIQSNVFRPQFHGREHLNVFNWMKALREGDKNLTQAFDLNMISISSEPTSMKYGYMEGLDFLSETEKDEKNLILKDGMDIFEQVFGFRSKSFIANCYIWHKDNEKILSEGGVKYIQGLPYQYQPEVGGSGHSHKKVYHYTGQKNKNGQVYLVRNVFFEPSIIGHQGIVDDCLQRIKTAFFWGKPAIISAHRLNFIGSINPKNRDRNLLLLKDLLSAIVKKWPDVEFVTSDQLGEIIEGSRKS